MSVATYPYECWPAIPRSTANALRPFARSVRNAPNRYIEQVADLLHLPIDVGSSTIYRCDHEQIDGALIAPIAGAIIVRVGQPAMIELSSSLATSIADRLLGGDGTPRAGSLSDGECGALAFLAACILSNEANADLATIVTTKAGALAILNASAYHIASWRIRIGANEGVLRLWLADGAHVEKPFILPENLAIPFVADVGEASLMLRELRRIRTGDTILLEESEHFKEFRVHARGSRRRVWWVDQETRSILRVESIQAPKDDRDYADDATPSMANADSMDTKDEPMREHRSDDHTSPASYDAPTAQGAKATDAVGDLPVSVAVEIARFSLSLEEVGALAEGEVLVSDSEIGDHVRLRALGQDIATGELVRVDGHVGVRILRRLIP